MADLNLQFIHDVLDIFVVKTIVNISHGLQCPDYYNLKEDKTENYFINSKEKNCNDDNKKSKLFSSRSQWLRGLKCGSRAASLLGLRVRILPG
jgi:hypothetical protein